MINQFKLKKKKKKKKNQFQLNFTKIFTLAYLWKDTFTSLRIWCITLHMLWEFTEGRFLTTEAQVEAVFQMFIGQTASVSWLNYEKCGGTAIDQTSGRDRLLFGHLWIVVLSLKIY